MRSGGCRCDAQRRPQSWTPLKPRSQSERLTKGWISFVVFKILTHWNRAKKIWRNNITMKNKWINYQPSPKTRMIKKRKYLPMLPTSTDIKTRIQKNQPCLSTAQMNWSSRIWEMPASVSYSLFCLSYEYIHIISWWGGCEHYSLSVYITVFICITHWLWFGHGSFQTLRLHIRTVHTDTPLLFILYLWIDQIQNYCSVNFTEKERRECVGANLCTPCFIWDCESGFLT